MNVENPVNKIKTTISKCFPNYKIAETKENQRNYASYLTLSLCSGIDLPFSCRLIVHDA